MEIFIDALAFWFAAACVYGVYQLSGELYKDIRATKKWASFCFN
jgi:hypothetical protein